MSWQVLRPQVRTLLQTLNTLQEVAPVPKILFNGYPSAHVVPSESPNDYSTNKENERIYAFVVRLFHETRSTGIQEAIEALEEVVDQVVDLFDQEDMKGNTERIVGIGLPASYTFLNIFATPSRWGELPEDQLVMSEVTIRVRVSVDIS